MAAVLTAVAALAAQPAGDGEVSPGVDEAVADSLERVCTIEQAKGLIIGRLGVDASTAAAELDRRARELGVDPQVLSLQLINAAASPHGERGDDPTSGLDHLI